MSARDQPNRYLGAASQFSPGRRAIPHVSLHRVPPAAAQQETLPPQADEIAARFPAIGRLGHAGFRTRQGCTATLIAPDLIATAAHFASDAGHSGRVFVAGWSRGDYVAARGTMSEIRPPAYGLDGSNAPGMMWLWSCWTARWKASTRWLGKPEEAAVDQSEVALIGHLRKPPHLPSGDFNCPVKRLGPGLMHVGCPVINGNSGGPLSDKNEQVRLHCL